MAERTGAAVTEVDGSHSVYLSQPGAVAALIERAARLNGVLPYPPGAVPASPVRGRTARIVMRESLVTARLRSELRKGMSRPVPD